MTVVEFDHEEFCDLVGRRLSMEDVETKVSMMGAAPIMETFASASSGDMRTPTRSQNSSCSKATTVTSAAMSRAYNKVYAGRDGPGQIWTGDLPVFSRALQPG